MGKRTASALLNPKQRSIFDFSLHRPRPAAGAEVIDLSLDIEQDGPRAADFASTVSVACPICTVNITALSLAEREAHVDACIDPVAAVKRPKSEHADPLVLENLHGIKSKVSCLEQTSLFVLEDDQVLDTDTDVPAPRVKREISAFTANILPVKVQRSTKGNAPIPHKESHEREKKRYLNQGHDDSDKLKVVKPPTKKISTTLKRKPIPQVKLLEFPYYRGKTYALSFDAFNYAPHATVDQYFLTHFHADHYGGITKSWSYERVFGDDTDFENDSKYKPIIYCTTITGKLLTIRIGVDPRFIFHMELDTRYCVKQYDAEKGPLNLDKGGKESHENTPGLYATPITANHCPGAAIFLMESIAVDGEVCRMLHCGDFRVCRDILSHPILAPFSLDLPSGQPRLLYLDKVYLDTTYMTPTYNFPKQELVCLDTANMFHDLCADPSLFETWFGLMKQLRITDFVTLKRARKKKKILVLVGTYVIGKEKLAVAILKRLGCQIYVLDVNSRGDKHRILRTYRDEYLDLVLTADPLGNDSEPFSQSPCVVHLVPMKIVGGMDHLSNYFNHNGYFEHFERCVGIRPTGWTFALPQAKAMGDLFNKDKMPCDQLAALAEMLGNSPAFSYARDILPQVPLRHHQKGSKASDSLYRIYTVPYSEHSSFRELAYFVVFFNIKNVIPTVNIHNEFSIANMLRIIDIWLKGRNLRSGESVHGTDGDDDLARRFKSLSLDSF